MRDVDPVKRSRNKSFRNEFEEKKKKQKWIRASTGKWLIGQVFRNDNDGLKTIAVSVTSVQQLTRNRYYFSAPTSGRDAISRFRFLLSVLWASPRHHSTCNGVLIPVTEIVLTFSVTTRIMVSARNDIKTLRYGYISSHSIVSTTGYIFQWHDGGGVSKKVTSMLGKLNEKKKKTIDTSQSTEGQVQNARGWRTFGSGGRPSIVSSAPEWSHESFFFFFFKILDHRESSRRFSGENRDERITRFFTQWKLLISSLPLL